MGRGKHKVFAGEVAKADHLLAGKPVVSWHDTVDLLADCRRNMDMGGADRIEDQRQISIKRHKPRLGILAIAAVQPEADRRVAGAVRGNGGRKKAAQRIGAAGNLHMTPTNAAEIRNLGLHPREIGELRADMLDENFAGCVQPHATGKTLEQRLADFILDLQDPPVQGCRGDGQLVGGLADRSFARHHIDEPQACHKTHQQNSRAHRAPTSQLPYT